MKHRIAIKRPNEELEQLDFDGTYRSDVKSLIGDENDGWLTLEYVMLRQTHDGRCLCLVCDEDGIAKNLPQNFNMITKAGEHRLYNNLVGNIVFLCYQWENAWEKEIYDYKLLDLNEDELAIIQRILSEPYQADIQRQRQTDPTLFHGGIFTFFDKDNFPQPPPLSKIPTTHMTFVISVLAEVGFTFTFFNEAEAKGGFEITVSKGTKEYDIIKCNDIQVAKEITIKRPCANANERGLRLVLAMELYKQVTALGVKDHIFCDGDIAKIITKEVEAFRNFSIKSQGHYIPYAIVMHHLSPKLAAHFAAGLHVICRHDRSTRRKALQELAAGILPKEEIDRIPIENWR